MDAYPLDENDLCTVCRESQLNFDVAYSFGSFEGSLQKLIHIFKYGKVESLAAPLGRLLLCALPLDRRFDRIVPVPMHWRKKWQRGFNQAELLAQPVARRYGLPVSNDLKRRQYSSAQASLNERERRKNLADAFEIRRPERVNGKRILLVDDVFTTGATLRAATAVLKNAGAAHVSVLTLARVDRRTWQPKYAPAGQRGSGSSFASSAAFESEQPTARAS